MTTVELADLCGIKPSLVGQYVKDGTIPKHFYRRDGRGGAGIDYSGLCVLVIEMVTALEKLCGTSSTLPKTVVRQVAPKLEAAWHSPTPYGPITATIEGAAVTIPAEFVTRAKELASAVAV